MKHRFLTLAFLLAGVLAASAGNVAGPGRYTVKPVARPEYALTSPSVLTFGVNAAGAMVGEKTQVWSLSMLSGSVRLFDCAGYALAASDDGIVRLAENNGSDESQLWTLENAEGTDTYWIIPSNKPELVVVISERIRVHVGDLPHSTEMRPGWLRPGKGISGKTRQCLPSTRRKLLLLICHIPL